MKSPLRLLDVVDVPSIIYVTKPRDSVLVGDVESIHVDFLTKVDWFYQYESLQPPNLMGGLICAVQLVFLDAQKDSRA
ncbi:hypothetical protein ABK046_50305, partial [Streptomyces caeruleatus]